MTDPIVASDPRRWWPMARRPMGRCLHRRCLHRFIGRLPPAAWIGGAGLLLVLLVVLTAALGGAGGLSPAAGAMPPTVTPAPTPTPTPPRPLYEGSVAELAPRFDVTAPGGAVGPSPTVSAMPPTVTPAPTPTPTPTRPPYEGSIAELALRFDVEEAMAHAQELASDAYAGRQGGSPGGREAAAYIARQFEALGLEPAGTEGYRQPFMLPYAEEASVPTLVITDAGGMVHDDLVFAEDYRHILGGYAAGGAVEGAVVWLGDCRPSDYAAHDVSGAIVMCRYLYDMAQITRAVREGAGALLLVTGDEIRIALRRALFEAPRAGGVPTLFITTEVAELLRGPGRATKDLGVLGARVRVTVDLARAGEAEGANVLGALPGADPTLGDQVVIIGAHYDHLGTDPNGAVYNGANDNASGVAALLEIVRSWREANYRPGVTVLFAAWDGEEQRLLGAQHYVEHPTYPLTATLGMIQLDMVGVAAEGTLTLDGAGNVVGRQLAASAALFEVPTAPLDWGRGSDHAAFLRAGVDAGLLIWDGAEVPNYHTPQDTVDTLQPERLRQAGIVASHAALALIRDAEGATARAMPQAAANPSLFKYPLRLLP